MEGTLGHERLNQEARSDLIILHLQPTENPSPRAGLFRVQRVEFSLLLAWRKIPQKMKINTPVPLHRHGLVTVHLPSTVSLH